MGHYDSRRIQKLAANKLKKTLEAPDRRALENGFAAAHGQDSDEALLAYVTALKRESGDRLKAADVIGYRYLTERLGPWAGIMTQVNEALRAEREQTNENEK